MMFGKHNAQLGYIINLVVDLYEDIINLYY